MYEVSEHVRTAPDGVVENNISYRGVDAYSANSSVHEMSSLPEMLGFRRYIRTMPEEVAKSNLFDRCNLTTNIYSNEHVSESEAAERASIECQERHVSRLTVYEVTFSILSKFCKVDRPVSKGELVYLKKYMMNLELNREEEFFITSIFNNVKKSQNNYQDLVLRYYQFYSGDADALKSMIKILFELALSDGELHPNEDSLIKETMGIFNMRGSTYEFLKKYYAGEGADFYLLEA